MLGTLKVNVEIGDPQGQRFEQVEASGGHRRHVHVAARSVASKVGSVVERNEHIHTC